MPYRRNYRRKRPIRRRRRLLKPISNNRKKMARLIRPLTLRPKSAVQKVVYHNTFICRPGLNGTSQQNFSFQILLNSPWLFSATWNAGSTGTNQSITPNEAIVTLDNSHAPTATSTIMPGVRVGGGTPFDKYQQGYVTGCKVTLVATPIDNTAGTPIQLGYFYTAKSSSGGLLNATHDITHINKLPFCQMKKLQGIQMASSWVQGNSSRITVTHSPRKYNNVKDLKDNHQMSFSTQTGSDGAIPSELDFLTLGIVPALNSYVPANASGSNEAPVTNFQLQMRVEQSILWCEPIDVTSDTTANLAYPVPAWQMGGFANGISNYMKYRYRRH